MLTWDKSLQKLDISAGQVLNLFRSMRDVQMALPGLPSQQASAYLCQYQQDKGVATIAVFHMQKSHQLAFYCSDPKLVAPQQSDSMFDQGLSFVESMGFLLADLDIHLLEENDRRMLWESLPLVNGISAPVEVAEKKPSAPVEPPPNQEKKTTAQADPVPKPEPLKQINRVAVKPQKAPVVEDIEDLEVVDDENSDAVDDLLAAVEAMRAKRPGLRARKKMPSPDELSRRRLELRENIGRILSSL